MILQVIAKVLISLCLIYGIIIVWTNEIDLKKTIITPLSSIIKFKKHVKLDINIKNTSLVRCILPGHDNSGNIGLLFYDLNIVNSSDENSTIKQVIVRYSLNGRRFATESVVLLTGTLYSPLEKKDINAVIVKRGADKIILMNWNNLRTKIGERKALLPGGVLPGSALFVLGIDSVEVISRIRNLELVVVDYSGAEAVQEIKLLDNWIEEAKHSLIENRSFSIDQAGNIKYSN
jgi:hypothetical protein